MIPVHRPCLCFAFSRAKRATKWQVGVYFTRFSLSGLHENLTLVSAATLSAFAGAFIGSKLLKKVTLELVQKIVTAMLIALSVALALGLI